MTQRILGIDIGSYSVKVAEIERDFRSFQLVGFFEQPIIHYETLGKEGSVSQALIKLFEEYNLPHELVYTAMPGQLCAHRVVDLPFADFKKVDATIEFELENYLPLPIEELLIDYQIISADKTGSTALVSYAKKSDFVKELNMMNGAELDPRFVGSEAVEFSNIMKMGVLQPEGGYALLDVGHEKTNVAIFVGSKLQFVRTIMVGGSQLTHAIAKAMNIPLEKAERMKVEVGQVGSNLDGEDATTRAVAAAMKEPLSELMLHLKQTLIAFQEKKGEVVQALFLCGGTSRLPGIDHYFSAELRKNVSFLDCLDLPFNQLADSEWCRPIAPTALSLAYRGVVGCGVRDIQFRRGEFSYQGEVQEVVRFTKQTAILLGVIAVFFWGSFISSYAALKGRTKKQLSRITTIATQVLPDMPKKTLSSPTTIVSALSGKLSEIEDKKKKIEEETDFSTLNLLKSFSAALPPKETVPLDVDNFTVISRKVKIQGRTNSFESVDQIKTALSQSKVFKNVTTDNVKKGTKDEIRFNLSFEMATESDVADGGAS